jgi:hypothetical protein
MLEEVAASEQSNVGVDRQDSTVLINQSAGLHINLLVATRARMMQHMVVKFLVL